MCVDDVLRCYVLVVGRINAQFLHNRAFCEECIIMTRCVDFYTSMNIKYRGIYEINLGSQKNRMTFLYKFLLMIKILKFQGSSYVA